MPSRKSALKNALINAAVKKTSAPLFTFKKISPVLIGLLAVAGAALYVVDNFDDGDKFNRNGGVWTTYSDAQEKGNSTVWPDAGHTASENFIMSQPGTGGTGYAARITGSTGDAFGLNYNYLGVVVRFDNKSSCPECRGSDIKKYNGIKFSVKGRLEGGQLYFILPYESNECIPERKTCGSLTGYADYETDITSQVHEDWSTVVINFRTDMKQPEWTPKADEVAVERVLENVHLFKWQYKNGNGKVMDLWIDDLVLF
jgi:hypothetical protein